MVRIAFSEYAAYAERFPTQPREPAASLAWDSAAGFAAWLSRTTGAYYRLPTEPEWELAARVAGDGDAWHAGNSGGQARPVGGAPRRGRPLHDFLGNAAEYVLETMDPQDRVHVLRGGSWATPRAELDAMLREPVTVRLMERDPYRPRTLWFLTDAPAAGFRIVRVPDPVPPALRAELAAKLTVRILGTRLPLPAETRRRGHAFVQVEGEIENGSGRTLRELEMEVQTLDDRGRPIRWDRSVGDAPPWRPLTARVWPVLPNSARGGKVAEPLPPGGKRVFTAFVPQAFGDDASDPARYTALVTQVCVD